MTDVMILTASELAAYLKCPLIPCLRLTNLRITNDEFVAFDKWREENRWFCLNCAPPAVRVERLMYWIYGYRAVNKEKGSMP